MRRFSTRAWVPVVFCGILSLGGATAETAVPLTPKTADGAEPDTTSASYGDWVLRCVRQNGGQRTCELQQTLEVKGQGTVAEIAIARSSKKGESIVTVLLPVNISFPSTVQILANDKDDSPAELSWRQCVPAACLAQVELMDDVIKRWKVQTTSGQIRFVNAAKQTTAFAFSFRGFVTAYDSLPKPVASQ
jgi:invasion protein IalB